MFALMHGRVIAMGNLLGPGDLAPADLATILALADDFAADPYGAGRVLAGRTVVLAFTVPALVTWAAVATAVTRLGGVPFMIGPGDWHPALGGSVAGTVPVLGAYAAALVVRNRRHDDTIRYAAAVASYTVAPSTVAAPLAPVVPLTPIASLARLVPRAATAPVSSDPVAPVAAASAAPAAAVAPVASIAPAAGVASIRRDGSPAPVVNAGDDRYLPLTAISALYTARRLRGDLSHSTLAYVGDGNPFANSLLLTAALAGVDVAVATPPGYEPDADAVAAAEKYAATSGARITVVHNPVEAVRHAAVVFADGWPPVMDTGEDAGLRATRMAAFTGYRVDGRLLACAPPGVVALSHRAGAVPGPAGYAVAANLLPVAQAVLFHLVAGAES